MKNHSFVRNSRIEFTAFETGTSQDDTFDVPSFQTVAFPLNGHVIDL